MKGFIYVLSNRAYPGLVKIGKARFPRARLKQLSGATGILYPFKMEAYFSSTNYTADEQLAHQELGRYRENQHKEFFRLPIDQAIIDLTNLLGEPKYTRSKHKAKIEQRRKQQEAEQVKLNQRLDIIRLNRQQEIQALKRQRQISMGKAIAIWTLVLVILMGILLAMRC